MTVEEATAAAQSLAAETDELGRLIAEFKLASMRSAQGAASRTRVRVSVPTRAPVQMRPTTNGNAALKALEDNWEEF